MEWSERGTRWSCFRRQCRETETIKQCYANWAFIVVPSNCSAIQGGPSQESRPGRVEAEEEHGGLVVGAEPGGGQWYWNRRQWHEADAERPTAADVESRRHGLCELLLINASWTRN